jgi:secondary thiamine-phosphate synthase enzyme
MMKSYSDYLWFNAAERRDLINITQEVSQRVQDSGIHEGLCLVSAMHITAGIWVNDHEPGLWQDFWDLLESLAPYRKDYRHHRTGEDNGDAHLKRTLIHHQALLPVTEGKLDLGPWEQIFYAEFDGRRRKRVVIKIIGE